MLSNPWFVGIGSGIIAGLISTIIITKVFDKVTKKDYLKNINMANKEVLATLKPLISEEEYPDTATVVSLVSSYALKYSVKSGDMLSTNEIVNELIREVFESSFIGGNNKLKISAQIITNLRTTTNKDYPVDVTQRLTASNKRLLFSVFISLVMLTILIVSMFAISSFINMYSGSSFSPFINENFLMFISAFMGIITMLVGLATQMKRKRQKGNQEHDMLPFE